MSVPSRDGNGAVSFPVIPRTSTRPPRTGYGFIQRSNGDDVLVHFSAIPANGYLSLDEGSEVEFEVKQGRKGLQAENVARV